MSEPVKIAEDLQEAYGHAIAARSGFVITLIQRVSAAEAELALAKEEIAALEAKCPAHEFCLDSDDAIRRRGAIAAEVSALREENARLKAPVSDISRMNCPACHSEMESIGFQRAGDKRIIFDCPKCGHQGHGATQAEWDRFLKNEAAMMAARSTASGGAQEAQKGASNEQ